MLSFKKNYLLIPLLILMSISNFLISKTFIQNNSCETSESFICRQEAIADCYDNCGGEENCSGVRFLGGVCYAGVCWQDFYWGCSDGTWGILYDCIAPELYCPLRK